MKRKNTTGRRITSSSQQREKNRIRDAKLKELQRWVNDKERKEKPLRYIICMATRMNTENQRSIYNNWE